MTLSADYLREAEQRARKFSGAYTGTSGTLAADVLRLLFFIRHQQQEISDMHSKLEESNQVLRDAVAARLAGNTSHQTSAATSGGEDAEIPVDWILRGERELKESREKECQKLTGDCLMSNDDLRPGSKQFFDVLDELKSLHLRKTLDYGVDEDALSNIRSSADVVNMPAWAGAILRISDKLHRLRAYFRRGRVEFDGVEDTLLDIACYAVIALVLYREKRLP